ELLSLLAICMATRRLFGSCAKADIGQGAAEPATTLMKSRRLIAPPKLKTAPYQSFSGLWKGSLNPPMSALGQKRTCAVQRPMSALPPIATAKADIEFQSEGGSVARAYPSQGRA